MVKVYSPNGQKDIENVSTMDVIFSYDEKEKKLSFQRLLKKSLKEEGELIKVELDDGNSHGSKNYIEYFGKSQVLAYTPNSIEDLQDASGFTIQNMKSSNFKWTALEDIKENDLILSAKVVNSQNYLIGDKVTKVEKHNGEYVKIFPKDGKIFLNKVLIKI